MLIDQTLCNGPAVSATTFPCFDPGDRASYIEFLDSGHQVLIRKPHTLVDNNSSQIEYQSYSFFGPAEGNGAVAHVVFYGGDSATAVNGSGVVLYNKSTNFTKTMLGSYQVNMRYINGDV
jgi:hypothetical protein